jgi:hypothetical protein
MPIVATKRANRPLATRWLADELELESNAVELDDAVVEAGVAVATAPTPPVTGPESEI